MALDVNWLGFPLLPETWLRGAASWSSESGSGVSGVRTLGTSSRARQVARPSATWKRVATNEISSVCRPLAHYGRSAASRAGSQLWRWLWMGRMTDRLLRPSPTGHTKSSTGQCVETSGRNRLATAYTAYLLPIDCWCFRLGRNIRVGRFDRPLPPRQLWIDALPAPCQVRFDIEQVKHSADGLVDHVFQVFKIGVERRHRGENDGAHFGD